MAGALREVAGWGDDGRVPDWWRIGRTPSREKQLEGLGERQASQVEGRGRVRLPGRHPTGCPAGPAGFLPCPGLWLPLLSPSNDPSQGAAAGRQCRETGPRRARRPWPQAPLAQPQPHLLKNVCKESPHPQQAGGRARAETSLLSKSYVRVNRQGTSPFWTCFLTCKMGTTLPRGW